jgi:uncharacterized protein DUF6484
MKKIQDDVEAQTADALCTADSDPLGTLVAGRFATSGGSTPASAGVVVGRLVGMTDNGRTPLVISPQVAGTTAVPARSVVDLHAAHVGQNVVLVFEDADPARPIVMGVLRDPLQSGIVEQPGHAVVDADGDRLIVSAKEELVLRCGAASITLTKAGKVLIHGAYVSSRATGVNRIKGGSVQLN